jgi:hypothetical protein
MSCLKITVLFPVRRSETLRRTGNNTPANIANSKLTTNGKSESQVTEGAVYTINYRVSIIPGLGMICIRKR